jgi:hypothetical protein
MNRRGGVGAAVGLALALTIASCHRSNERITLDNSSNGRTISAAPGDTIEVTLQTIGPGQYETPTVFGPIRFLGESAAGAPNPGGPRQLFRFQAVTTGRGEITILHTVLPPGLPQTPPYVLSVDVR